MRLKNKKYVIEKLMEKTTYDESMCMVICDILESHFIIGKNNKEKIKESFIIKLSIDDKKADELYNTCAEIIVSSILKKDKL